MTIDRKRNIFISVVLIISSLITAHLSFWLLPNVFETWNARAIDQLFKYRSNSKQFQPNYDGTIVHVDLNNTSIQQLNDFYLNRLHHAQVIKNLSAMKVAIQLYDFIFAAKSDETHDQTLIKTTREAGNVYLGLAFELWEEKHPHKKPNIGPKRLKYLNRTKWNVTIKGGSSSLYVGGNPLITFPELSSASKGLGFLSIKCDRDGVFRRVPLIVRYNGAYYPSSPFRAICDYLNVQSDHVIVEPGKQITLKNAKPPKVKSGHDIVIPIDRFGNMRINFIGAWDRMNHYNFSDVLRASEDRDELEMWQEELSGKIVVVSEVSTGSTDVGPVPTDTNFPLSGLHANVMNTVLTESFLSELPSRGMMAVEIILIVFILCFSLWFSSLYFSIGIFTLATTYFCIVSVTFLYSGIILHLIRPLLMIIFAMISIVVYRYIKEEKEKLESMRQRDFIRATFGRYLSNDVVEDLLSSPAKLEITGELREVTFLVADLRGFTALSSKLAPKVVIDILNRYLEHMISIVAQYKGTVNEIEGDGILVFFGAPVTASDDPERAVACAIEMQNVMMEINEKQRQLNLPKLSVGIGINSGRAVIGNIGSEERVKYTAIGNSVNTTYRIESVTVGGQIIISPSTFEKVKSIVLIKGCIKKEFKGIKKSLALYDVIGLKGKYNLALSGKTTESMTILSPPLPLNCYLIIKKTISEKSISGQITRLGRSSAEISLDKRIEVHSNLKIILDSIDGSELSEIYAKVVSADQPKAIASGFKVNLEFTWLPTEMKVFLEKVIVENS